MKSVLKKTLLVMGFTGSLLTGLATNSLAADTIGVKIVCDSDIQLQTGDVFYVTYETDSGEKQKFKLDASQLTDSDGSIVVDSINSVSDLEYAGNNKNLKEGNYEAFLITDTNADNEGSGSGVAGENAETVYIAIGSQSISNIGAKVQSQPSSKDGSTDKASTPNSSENDSFFKSILSTVDFSGFFHQVGKNTLIVGGVLVVGLLVAWILKLNGRLF